MNRVIQESLFDEFDTEVLTDANTFCIKSINNPTTSIEIDVQPGQDPESVALELLGYFLVSKRSYA